MNKILGILISGLAIFGLASCSDDDAGGQYTRKSELSVVSSNVLFSANASDSGRVVVSAPGAITAKTDAQWATATVSGNTVNVSVTDNAKVEGRASVLTIFSGQDSVNVTVQQLGLVYKFGANKMYVYNDSARTITVPATYEGTGVSATPNGDWATASFDHDGIHINMTENNTGEIRSGKVYVQAGPYKDTVTVYQGELKDLLNHQYYFAGYDLGQISQQTKTIDELFVSMKAQVRVVGDQPVIYLQDMNFTIPFQFLEDNLWAVLRGGQKIGTYYGSYPIYTAIVDYDVMAQMAKSDERFPALMASPYMGLVGQWFGQPPYGNAMEVIGGLSMNLTWMQIFFENLTSYSPDILAFFAFSSDMSPWINADGKLTEQVLLSNLNSYQGSLNLIMQPMLLEADHLGGGAKPMVLPLSGTRKAATSKADVQKMLGTVKQSLKAGGMKRLVDQLHK